MAYELTKRWDGTNIERVMNPVASAGITNVSVGLSATLIAPANAARQCISIANQGGSAIYLGTDTAITAASTGKHFAILPAATSRDFKDYQGDIYGILVNGVSGNVQPIGVLGVPTI